MAAEEKAPSIRAHVLLLPYPAQGHMNPMIQFAKRLEFKGLKVTLATTHFIINTVQFETGSIGIEPISDGFDQGGFLAARSIEDYVECLKVAGSRTLAELIEKLDHSGKAIDCIVYDPFLPWALDITKQFGLSGAAFFTQSCTTDAIYYHAYHQKLVLPLETETVTLPGLPPLRISDLPSLVSVPKSYPAYVKLLLNQFSNMEKADWVLLNSFDKLEDEVLKWMVGLWPARAIGPTVPSLYLDKRIEGDDNYNINFMKPDRDACLKWLDERAVGSVVYVSMGSMADISMEQMEEFAWGLKGSNKNFLWVVRNSEKSKLPSNFEESTADVGLMISWCPQLEVLAHQAVGSFVTHCGWNSILEALSLGVPVIGVPQWTDQPTNAKLVEDVWRVGLRAKTDEKGIVRREEIEFCVREKMEGERGEEFKKNAGKWREFAIEAVDEGGSSDKNIDEFVSSLVKS